MSDLARVLTPRGTERFRAWLIRGAPIGEPTPLALLIDPECSSPLAHSLPDGSSFFHIPSAVGTLAPARGAKAKMPQ
jgi:hypothetical protein